MKNKKWRSRDWLWLVGILISLIVLILTVRLGDNLEVINLFSFISSSVSIALALVAIFIALKQESENNRVTSQMTNTLTKIELKVNSMDGKIDDLDPNVVTKPFQKKLIKEIEEIVNNQQEGENDKKIKEIVTAVNKNFNEINKDLQFYYDHDKPKKFNRHKILIAVPSDDAAVDRCIVDLAAILDLERYTYDYSNRILKFYYVANEVIGLEPLATLIKKYEGFHLIDWGIDGNTKGI
ncbi:hypothetical protein [Bacillus thuringiensis]|uniref:hypothetical protein n=1 Tax=Bacillus thuringiensis TaxID=1428 RepID=UPI000BF9B6A3|nr:hypothetical protein [Bacillus thuringiensis]PFF28427.1 hypothetical protein CN332_04465 [Bacillus thuringiensis]